MNLKNKILFLFVQSYEKRKEVSRMEMSRDDDQKRKYSPYIEVSHDTGEYKSSDL